MSRPNPLLAVFVLTVVCATLVSAQNSNGSNIVVPRLVNYSGKAVDDEGNAISGMAGVTFAIYSEQSGGSPLWTETQNIQADSKGNYTAPMGAAEPQGLPLDLFTSGEARWLGIRINGGEEQPRVLLLSVPYALKAADAQTLGGFPASAFALAAPAGSRLTQMQSGAASSTTVTSNSAAQLLVQGNTPVTTAGGTVGAIPLWDSSSDITSSIIAQTGSGTTAKIGINIAKPLFTLDVKGTELVRGLFEMATTQYATKSKGFNSNPMNLESSAWSSTTGTYTLNHFQWQAEPVGNNTPSPGATLNLLYGTDPNPPSETGLTIASNGQLTFARGQTFPGTGSVTNVGLSAPTSDFTVTGSPVTTSGTLGLAWQVAPSPGNTANAIVKRDSTGSFSAGAIAASLGVTSYVGSGNAIYGQSNGSATGSNGVEGVTNAGSGSGVVGLNFSGASGSLGMFGQGDIGMYGTGTTTGVYGHGSSFGFATDSNVQQARSAGGWVKAMAYVQGMTPPYTITRCFNSTLAGAAATTPPCGFNLGELLPGDFALDFGFQVNDRFILATPDNADTACTMYAGAGPYVTSDTAVEVRCVYGGGINSYPFRASVFVF